MKYIAEYLSEYYVVLFLIIGMTLILIGNSQIGKYSAKYLMHMLSCIFWLTLIEFSEKQMAMLPHPTIIRMLLCYLFYTLRPFASLTLLLMVSHDWKRRWLLYAPLVANDFLYYLAFFTHLIFWFDEENGIHYGPLSFLGNAVTLLYLVVLFVCCIRIMRREHKLDSVMLLFGAAMCFGSIFVESFTNETAIFNTCVITSGTLYYLFLHIQNTNRESIRKDALLTEQRTQLMISQIQPHFLYNTLATIKSLCHSNPILAAETVENFSDYLRGNMSTMGNIHPIPFEKELEHTKTYARIEMLRFPFVTVEYDIKDTDFLIPSLSVQPMVENAIRYGVRVRDEGKVIVRTYNDGTNHIVEIEDNGCGFVVGEEPENNTGEKHMHIGIKNVRERIERMVFGTMTIESTLDVGTKITFTIPIGK